MTRASLGVIGLGVIFLIVAVFAHVAEHLHILPAMGWGLPHSPGHYLDLASAILACILIPAGIVFGCLRCSRN